MAATDEQRAVLLKLKIPREMVDSIKTKDEAAAIITNILDRKASVRGRR